MTNRGWGGPLIMLNCMPTCSQVEKFDQDYHISADLSYPATRSIGQNSRFTVFLFVCRVTDFSAGSLPIGVKFCMAIRPNLKQVLSHFGGRAPGTAEFWASTGAIWWICFLMKQLFFSSLNTKHWACDAVTPDTYLTYHYTEFNWFETMFVLQLRRHTERKTKAATKPYFCCVSWVE